LVDVEIIKHLVELMVENDLAEVSIRNGEDQVCLKRTQASHAGDMPVSVSLTPHAAVANPAPPVPAEAPPPPADEGEDPDADLVAVPSPMVGTFYAASDPSSSQYVKVGDTVTPDTVVCIIEAMKVFNEIKAGVVGVIERTLVANETAVEYDQPLFLVRPS